MNSLHPATYMNTTMVRAGGITPISTVEQGGAAILHLVTGDDVAGKSGLFFNGMNEAKANPQAYDAARASGCATLSLELTGLPRREAVTRPRALWLAKALRSRHGIGAAMAPFWPAFRPGTPALAIVRRCSA